MTSCQGWRPNRLASIASPSFQASIHCARLALPGTLASSGNEKDVFVGLKENHQPCSATIFYKIKAAPLRRETCPRISRGHKNSAPLKPPMPG